MITGIRQCSRIWSVQDPPLFRGFVKNVMQSVNLYLRTENKWKIAISYYEADDCMKTALKSLISRSPDSQWGPRSVSNVREIDTIMWTDVSPTKFLQSPKELKKNQYQRLLRAQITPASLNRHLQHHQIFHNLSHHQLFFFILGQAREKRFRKWIQWKQRQQEQLIVRLR